MKIKNVKITGFRAFQKEEDSTFDFTNKGEIVNFASIYAPNGFGKTSFYDAVEWCLTHKIQRFDRMVDFDRVRKDNDAPLLLNKSSFSGKVVVETSSQKFENIINRKKVYKYNEKPINEYFQNQILTQDLIDAFLKEEKADKRYERFLEIDENLKNYDSAYKKIIRLLDYIKDKTTDLIQKKREETEKLQGNIDFEEEFKKFDEINEVFLSLNEDDEDLEFIEQKTFNQTSYDNLLRKVDVRLSSLKNEVVKAKLRIENIILARNGEETGDGKFYGGTLSYLENKSKIQNLDKQLLELKKIVKLFEEKERIINESSVNDENLKSHLNKLKRALNIEKKFQTYFSIQKEIDNSQKNIADYKDILIKTEHEKLDIVKEKTDREIKINELRKSLEINQSKLNNVPTQKKQLESTNQTIVDLKKIIDDLSKSIDKEEVKLNELKLIINDFKYYENKIDDDIEVLLNFKLFDENKKLINHYVAEKVELDKLKRDIQITQFKIDNQNKFNKELTSFINLGLGLVSKTQSSNCPLCNHNYNSFEKLSEKILSNKILDLEDKFFLEEMAEIELKINELELKLPADKEKIKKKFLSIKQPYLLAYKNIEEAINKFDSERSVNLEKLSSSQLILNDINLSLDNNKTFEEFFIKIQNEISILEAQIFEFSNQIKKNDAALLEKDSLIKLTREKLEISEIKLLQYQSLKEYKETKQYFIEELNSNEVEENILSLEITNLKINITDLTGKKESLISSLDELKTKLSNYTLSKNEYINKIQQVNDAKNLAIRFFNSYENLIKSEFGIAIADKDKSQIENAFFDLIDQQRKLERHAESKIERYRIVKILNDACIKATESKKIKDNIDQITSELQGLNNSKGVLKIEKENLKAFLKKTIESYFYTPLINSIYRKIDPHPDYKSIEFECDFAENKPRLQIYTLSITDKGKVRSVPSLYFSTAQVNILSLSIFLARALKTKDDQLEPVDCIFIDDPIQSMDSINILSFIDLFRGITLCLNKQLIVSTHEENFHLLLQKKMPSELFKSKFIEFETFGKIKS
ncbi:MULTISPECIES: hypothetical protein [unclassified Leeuwenhoekiella]|uniref:hypothetical protein n=1 Tax=unclassified Leeuwenhoekiella TaxID=2615029 RepID=UPI000C46D8F4|nr:MULTISPECIES: hypothetical protein [unclassified Leeuwenhoekiella]MAW95371.1 hypothetical protein [Leeuwenhoekiella sp.]MBA80733.1 hypothetical protein [Leeuwenhoekiella sp.]|tara:strand:- start:1212 stop:4337 length:3126 start_codon:yes stop_codon:yes gene_type:complete